MEVPIDARFVLLALELVRSAGYVLTDRWHLVVALGTILFPVTDPALVDAGDPILALVLERETRIHDGGRRVGTTLE